MAKVRAGFHRHRSFPNPLPSRLIAGAAGFLNLSQSSSGRLTAIAMVVMVVGYLV
jgi:hypothetical protein